MPITSLHTGVETVETGRVPMASFSLIYHRNGIAKEELFTEKLMPAMVKCLDRSYALCPSSCHHGAGENITALSSMTLSLLPLNQDQFQLIRIAIPLSSLVAFCISFCCLIAPSSGKCSRRVLGLGQRARKMAVPSVHSHPTIFTYLTRFESWTQTR